MEYEIDVTDTAFAEIDDAYQWIKEWAPDAAESWYEGLMTALRSLRQNPRRCPRTFATNRGVSEVRQLIYGRRRGRYRVLFTIHRETVTILRVRHGARAPIRR
jgi:plasmid stabilization system protein ParE